MNPLSSSISSSELTRLRAVFVVVWTLVGLIAIDIAVNLAFPYPNDPKVTRVGMIPAYFEYGRSIEGKLATITRTSVNETAPITLAGWYKPLKVEMIGGPAGAPIVSFYGMSHSVRLAHALVRTSHHFQSRSIGAPGGTANWALGAFLHDIDRTRSKVAVLSIMSMTAPMDTTMTAMTWNSAFPMPYTEERFELAGSGLRSVDPPFESFEGYVHAFYDPRAWSRARAEFKAHDAYYNDFLVRRSIFDRSVIMRMLRRSYGLHLERESRSNVLDERGFKPDSEQVRVLNAIIRSFAARARKDGIVPVIFVVNNLGYGTVLYDAVKDTLIRCNIPYLSSHAVVSPQDPRGYLPDSHFTDANDDRLAKALERLIDAKLFADQTKTRSSVKCDNPPYPLSQT